jgi:aquaporin Z
VGGWALGQLWLFIVAPLIGALLAVGVYVAIRQPEALITARQAEQALESQQAEQDLQQGRSERRP